MNAYILTILAASLAAAIIELLAPKGDGGRIAAHVRMIAGLFLLVALLNPLKEGILLLQSAVEGDLTDRLSEAIPNHTPTDYEAAFGDTLTAVGKKEVEAWVASTLENVFGIPSSGYTVEAVCESVETTVTLREVRISLHGKYILENPHPIEAYVTEQLKCSCYVTVHP
ncbi:MAG: hypothetical protein IJX72_05705 [Clostridia bacterium]|nr:hypothetical protein [Clostridia bacterium]